MVDELTLGYAAFLMGYVTLVWLQAAVERARVRIGGRTDLRAVAESAGTDYHGRIDADTVTVYDLVPTAVKYLLGGWLCSLLALAILVEVNRLVVATFALSMPYLYTTLAVVFVERSGGQRATHMADAITTLAEEGSYDRVAVLCGDAHREAVGEELERREWTVTTHPTRHPLGRLLGR